MWLLVEPGTDAAVICVDSLYAANESEGYWSAKSSRELVTNCQEAVFAASQRGQGRGGRWARALLESGSSLALEALAARMRDWSISAYGGSVVSAELSLSQVSRPND